MSEAVVHLCVDRGDLGIATACGLRGRALWTAAITNVSAAVTCAACLNSGEEKRAA